MENKAGVTDSIISLLCARARLARERYAKTVEPHCKTIKKERMGAQTLNKHLHKQNSNYVDEKLVS